MTPEAEVLHQQLGDALMYLLVPDQYEKEIKKLKINERQFHENYKAKKNIFRRAQRGILGIAIPTFLTPAVIAPAFIFIATFSVIALFVFRYGLTAGLLIVTSTITLCFMPLILGVSAVLAFAAALIYWIFYRKKHISEADAYWKNVATPAIQKIRKKIRELETELERFLKDNRYVLEFLPDDYRDTLSVGYMEECVRNLRAETLKEALNLYEEQKHRWAMENLAQQMLVEAGLRNRILQDGLNKIYNEQRRTSAIANNIRNLSAFNTGYTIYKDIVNR